MTVPLGFHPLCRAPEFENHYCWSKLSFILKNENSVEVRLCPRSAAATAIGARTQILNLEARVLSWDEKKICIFLRIL